MKALIIIILSIFLALTFNYFRADENNIPLFKQPPALVEDINCDPVRFDTLKTGEYLNVGYAQVKENLDNEEVIIIDARPKEEWEESRIGNAINIFPYDEDEDPDTYNMQLLDLPEDKIILIYCHGGNCDLSHMLAEDLSLFGKTCVYIYTGGWNEWVVEEGLEG